MLDCVKKGMRALFRSKLRTFLTIGGIAIGVFSVILISIIGEIGRGLINGQMDSMGMNSIVVTGEKSSLLCLDEADLERLKDINGIDNAMPLMSLVTHSLIHNKQSPCMLWGVNEDAGQVIELIPLYGRMLNQGDIRSGARVCMIDDQLAKSCYSRTNIVGKTIRVNTGAGLEDFKVVGVVKNGVNLLQNMLGEIIPGFVYIPYTTLQEESGKYYFDNICVKLTENGSSDMISGQIRQTIASSRNTGADFQVDDLLKQKSQMNEILSVITVVLSLIAGISLIVSGISIMTVMLVSVNERTREIGIKKSIGATNAAIMTEFLLESVLITFFGGISGCAMGLMLSYLGCVIAGIPFAADFNMIGITLIFALCVGLIFGVYPAKRAASLKPVDALRME